MKPGCRRIPDTTPWTKPPTLAGRLLYGDCIALSFWAVPVWNGPEIVGDTRSCYRRARCGAIVLTKHTGAMGTAAKRLSPIGVIARDSRPSTDDRFAIS